MNGQEKNRRTLIFTEPCHQCSPARLSPGATSSLASFLRCQNWLTPVSSSGNMQMIENFHVLPSWPIPIQKCQTNSIVEIVLLSMPKKAAFLYLTHPQLYYWRSCKTVKAALQQYPSKAAWLTHLPITSSFCHMILYKNNIVQVYGTNSNSAHVCPVTISTKLLWHNDVRIVMCCWQTAW